MRCARRYLFGRQTRLSGASRGRGGEFVNRSQPLAEIALSIRKDMRRGLGIDAEGGYDWSASIEAQPDLCVVNSRGTCTPSFPAFGGPFGLLGVTLGAPSAIQLRLNTGIAAYTDNQPRLGAPVAAIDVALAPMSWLAIVAGGRAFALPNYQGQSADDDDLAPRSALADPPLARRRRARSHVAKVTARSRRGIVRGNARRARDALLTVGRIPALEGLPVRGADARRFLRDG